MQRPIFSIVKDYVWLPYASVDLRSLAVFRVLIALAILVSLFSYLPNAGFFFAPGTGLVLRAEAIGRRPDYWSILYISESMLFIYAFFTVYTLAALALLFGYKTRVATIICWVCTVSLKNRGYQFTNYGDIMHGIYLFWAMFLPLGARFSVDAALAKTSAPPRYASLASLGLLLNVMYVYFFGALHKTGYDWQEFSAVYYALSNLELTTVFAPYLLRLDWLLPPLTAYVYYLELFSPLLLFLPRYTERARLLAVPLLLSLHIGFALCLTVNIFSLVAAAGVLAFLPTVFWERAIPWYNRRKTRQGIHIFYDKDCQFCFKLCLIFKTLGLPNDTPITPAQDDATAGPILARDNTWVVRTHAGTYLTHWEAVSYVWRRSPLLWPLGVLFSLPWLRDAGHELYLLIAKYRPQLAKISARFLTYDEKPIYQPQRAAQAFLTAMIVLVLAQNLRTVSYFPKQWPYVFEQALLFTEMKQDWLMYSPSVKNAGDWLVIEGTTFGNETVDLLHTDPSPPSHARPEDGWALYPDVHMRRYLTFSINWKKQGPRLIRHLCDRFVEAYPEIEIGAVTVHKYRQMTAPPGQPPGAVSSNLVYSGKCQE